MTNTSSDGHEVLHDFSTDALATAVEVGHAGYFAFISRIGDATGPEALEMTHVLTGLPHPLFNGVLHARLDEGQLDAQIEAALSPFRARGLSMFWWVGPRSRPAGLGDRLQTHGLRPVGDMPGMAVDLQSLRESALPSGFSIETVVDVEGLREWGHVTNRSFDIPESLDAAWLEQFHGAGLQLPVRYYLGRHAGRPVAASVLGLFGGTAGLYGVATVPEARQRGFGAAITLAPLLDARSMGYRVGVLSASRMGFSVYQRMGFEECCQLWLYAGPGEPGAGGNIL